MNGSGCAGGSRGGDESGRSIQRTPTGGCHPLSSAPHPPSSSPDSSEPSPPNSSLGGRRVRPWDGGGVVGGMGESKVNTVRSKDVHTQTSH